MAVPAPDRVTFPRVWRSPSAGGCLAIVPDNSRLLSALSRMSYHGVTWPTRPKLLNGREWSTRGHAVSEPDTECINLIAGDSEQLVERQLNAG